MNKSAAEPIHSFKILATHIELRFVTNTIAFSLIYQLTTGRSLLQLVCSAPFSRRSSAKTYEYFINEFLMVLSARNIVHILRFISLSLCAKARCAEGPAVDALHLALARTRGSMLRRNESKATATDRGQRNDRPTEFGARCSDAHSHLRTLARRPQLLN